MGGRCPPRPRTPGLGQSGGISLLLHRHASGLPQHRRPSLLAQEHPPWPPGLASGPPACRRGRALGGRTVGLGPWRPPSHLPVTPQSSGTEIYFCCSRAGGPGAGSRDWRDAGPQRAVCEPQGPAGSTSPGGLVGTMECPLLCPDAHFPEPRRGAERLAGRDGGGPERHLPVRAHPEGAVPHLRFLLRQHEAFLQGPA